MFLEKFQNQRLVAFQPENKKQSINSKYQHKIIGTLDTLSYFSNHHTNDF